MYLINFQNNKLTLSISDASLRRVVTKSGILSLQPPPTSSLRGAVVGRWCAKTFCFDICFLIFKIHCVKNKK